MYAHTGYQVPTQHHNWLLAYDLRIMKQDSRVTVYELRITMYDGVAAL